MSGSSSGPPSRCSFEVFTLFPHAIEGFVGAGLLGKAIEQGLVTVRCTDFRDFTPDRHRTVDDAPFGGGAGMVIKPGPVVDAMEHVARERGPFHRVLLTPSAPRFDQRVAARLARLPRVGLLCGRYEGIDDRVREHYVDECLSLGDFVLGGGEVAALVIIEAISRLVEGVVGNPESVHTDSFGREGEAALLEHPHYTRPAVFRGHAVPPVLLGGDHAAIARWRHRSALRRTWSLRPELRPRPGLPVGHPIHLAVPAVALPDAAALAAVARHHGVTGLAVVGRGPDVLPQWLQATGGRIAVAVFSDPKALRRRLGRGALGEPRFIHVVEPRPEPTAEPGTPGAEPGTPGAEPGTPGVEPGTPGVAEAGIPSSSEPPCEDPAALLDLLVGGPGDAPLGPLVLWPHPEPPPPSLPIHAIYAPKPHADPALGPDHGLSPASAPDANPEPSRLEDDLTSGAQPRPQQGLAIEHAIADISRPCPRTAALAHAALTGLRDRG